MTTETVHVPAISCDHCKSTIERELMDMDGMRQVVVDVAPRRVTFTYDAPATPATITAQMDEIGYPVVEGLDTNRPA